MHTVWSIITIMFRAGCYLFPERGHRVSLTCMVKEGAASASWQLYNGKHFIDLGSCTLDNNTCTYSRPSEYSGSVVKKGDENIAYLNITSARTNETIFRCTTNTGAFSNACHLKVYDVPRNIVCDPVDVDYTKMNLQFRCTAENVYPAIIASVNIIGAAVTKEDFISSHCSNAESGSDTLEPYTAECIWRLPAKKLEPLTYKYKVKMFPDVSNGTEVDVPNIVSNYFTLQLKSPQAAIDYHNCSTGPGLHNGHLLAGSTASCKCVLENPGFPPGQARWYDLHGNRSVGLDNLADGSSTLILYNKTSGQSYQCRADSALTNLLNWGPIYSPVFKSESKNKGPSSSHEGACFRLELVVGIPAGSVVLIILVAIALWKCKSSNQQSAQTAKVEYNAHNDYMTPLPGPRSTDCADYASYISVDDPY